MKDDQVHSYVTMELKVPRGLVRFLEKMQAVTGEVPQEHLETLLRKDLECIIGSLSNMIFDYKFIRTTYGEGSDCNYDSC
jgi:hypothetical protein